MAWVERVGTLHVHSRYSDGAGDVEEILRAARDAGLDHVVLTDHDTLAAAREGWGGTHDGVTLLVGVEITPKRRGHVLALQVDHCEGYATQLGAATLDSVLAQGGRVIVAHPQGKQKLSLGIRHAPWYDWHHPAVQGLEIWSYTHDWVDEVEWWRLPEAYAFWRHPERQVKGPSRAVLDTWDRLGLERRLSGLGALDCHARRIPLTGWVIFSYERMFRWLRNHLFVREEDMRRDPQAALWQALLEGRGYVAHDILADARGVRCGALLPNGRALQLGEEAPWAAGAVMTLALPRAAEVHWMENGRLRLREHTARMAVHPAGPGVNRFEVYLNGRPWIFTNPVYLR